MKKVGIITIISHNYGNRLQNYALQEVLIRDLGCSVRTLPVVVRSILERSDIGKRLKTRIKCLLRHPDAEWMCFDLKIHFARRPADPECSAEYDFFITGSDQVWNPSFSFITEREFLTFAREEQRIAYAASIGMDALLSGCVEAYSGYLGGFRAISVREESAAEIVRELTGQTVPILVDPTMMLSCGDWLRLARPYSKRPSGKYILTYFLGGRSEAVRTWMEDCARTAGLELFDLMAHSEDHLGPAEFLSLMDNAERVFTDSFHGTVFSILFKRPFAVFAREEEGSQCDMSNRMTTLLRRFHFEDRMMGSLSATESDRLAACDFSESEALLDSERKKTLTFLRKALGCNEMHLGLPDSMIRMVTP